MDPKDEDNSFSSARAAQDFQAPCFGEGGNFSGMNVQQSSFIEQVLVATVMPLNRLVSLLDHAKESVFEGSLSLCERCQAFNYGQEGNRKAKANGPRAAMNQLTCSVAAWLLST
eukprot:scaffold77081_cov17-Tisochrysis_lutea.AAC.1